MAEAVGVRAVPVGHKPQIQRVINPDVVDRALQEPTQLLHLQVSAFNTEHPIPAHHLGYQRSRRRQLHHASSLGHVLIFRSRFEHQNVHVVQRAQGALDLGPHSTPIQTAIAAPQWRQGDRPDALFFHYPPPAGLTPFAFYNPFDVASGQQIGSNYDPTGNNTQGRVMVVFRGNWAQATDIARTNVQALELVEVA
jgi:hypothetical protein